MEPEEGGASKARGHSSISCIKRGSHYKPSHNKVAAFKLRISIKIHDSTLKMEHASLCATYWLVKRCSRLRPHSQQQPPGMSVRLPSRALLLSGAAALVITSFYAFQTDLTMHPRDDATYSRGSKRTRPQQPPRSQADSSDLFSDTNFGPLSVSTTSSGV